MDALNVPQRTSRQFDYFAAMSDITCRRCGQTRAPMAFQPFNNEIGRRVFEQICGVCWAEWLKMQQQLINHYGLNLRDAQAKEFLFQQMETFLFAPAADHAP
jgi:Fe-S cluster biosynthesis and repair protein YggX